VDAETKTMATGTLSIDLDAIAANWRALNDLSDAAVETAAVVKADGYGLGAGRVARALAAAGARKFFVAVVEEGVVLREALGPGPEIFVFSGHMEGDTDTLSMSSLTPMVNSIEQLIRHLENEPERPFGIQLDTGMNRLGMELNEWAAVAEIALSHNPTLIISHLACADDPSHPQNRAQLEAFHQMTDGIDVPRSLSATGGVLLGPEYHFDLVRPGIGLYGGLPYEDARAVARLSLPVIQTRDLEPGETVGYSATWTAERPARIATVSAGYADGLIRAMSGQANLYAGDIPCPLAGRVSMDLLTVDVTHLEHVPETLDILGPYQTVDQLADAAGTIGYEILTSLGGRYLRSYKGRSL
jgi:alanine racemase